MNYTKIKKEIEAEHKQTAEKIAGEKYQTAMQELNIEVYNG